MSRSSRWSNQSLAHISSPPNICYMPYISHPLQVDHKDTTYADLQKIRDVLKCGTRLQSVQLKQVMKGV